MARRWPSVATMVERARLQHQQRAIQRVARFFERNREGGLGDHFGEQLRGNLHQRVRESRERGKIILGHAHELVIPAVAGDVHPVIFEKLKFDLLLREASASSSKSFFAGMVPAPSFFTLASQDVRMLSSRSVAVMVRRLPFASTRRFERMGMVVLRSTTPCVRFEFVEQVRSFYAEFHLQAVLAIVRA